MLRVSLGSARHVRRLDMTRTSVPLVFPRLAIHNDVMSPSCALYFARAVALGTLRAPCFRRILAAGAPLLRRRTVVLLGCSAFGITEVGGIMRAPRALACSDPPPGHSCISSLRNLEPPPVAVGAKGTFPIFYQNISFNRKKSGLELHSSGNGFINDICCLILNIYRGHDRHELIFSFVHSNIF